MSSFLPAGGSGTGGGILYPDSAARPFASNSARNTWANNNKQDLIKDTTVVNVGGSQWYLWTGESNPDSVNNNLWMDADQIVPGETGGDGVSITTVTMNADGDLIIDKDDGTSTNVGRVRGLSAYEFWLSQGNTGTEQDYLDSLKGEKGDSGGFNDNGAIFNLGVPFTQYFETAPEGKFYLDGWDDASGLPTSIPNNERVFLVTNFSGYDDVANGARVQFSSHLYGIYEANKSAGAWSELVRIDQPKLSGAENELMKMGPNGTLIPTGVFSGKSGSATFGSGSIDIGMHNISSAGEGVEATNQGTGESYSFVFAGQGDDTGPVHRLLSDNQVDIETVTTKTKQLTNHVSRLTAPYAFRLLRMPITIDAVSAQTNVTMQIRDLNGEDRLELWPV